MAGILESFSAAGWAQLAAADLTLYDLLEREHRRQAEVLMMVASSSVAEAGALACVASTAVNVTGEGYPGRRFQGGCQHVDAIEQLAVRRAKSAFGARYANVQPHSATTANQIVMFSLLEPGDTILGLELKCGGHLSHGAKASISGKYFNAVGYGLDSSAHIDYASVRQLALEHQPKLIICGTTSYSRTLDFSRFRQIADEAGAYLLADMTHIAGLVAAGLHPSPIDQAHFTTTCMHKQLCGPRGGLILMGRDYDSPGPQGLASLAETIDRSVFPLVQGSPAPNSIAAKAFALARLGTPEFRALAERILSCSRSLAQALMAAGYAVVGGGSDNHMVVVDLTARGLSGLVAERALEQSGIIVNKNLIPGDPRPAAVASGIRLGTNSLAARWMAAPEMAECAHLIDLVLGATRPASDTEYHLDPAIGESVAERVRALCKRFPLAGYLSRAEEHAGS
jgi:glycine hydroxymethyltransferase